MATSIVPALLAALHSTMTAALPDINVTYGVGITNDPGDWLMIGIQDPDADIPTGATGTEGQLAFGALRPRLETGTIYLTAFSWNGDADQKAACDAVYAIAGAVAATVRPADLAVAGLQTLGYAGDSTTTLRLGQSDFGAIAELMFAVTFTAQI